MSDFNYVEMDVVQYILERKPGYFLHGCNCANTMGAGVAGALARVWPAVLEVDQLSGERYAGCFELFYPQDGVPFIPKLGTSSYTEATVHTTVVNLYSQLYPGGDFRMYAYQNALHRLLLMKAPGIRGQTIAMPRIGCGIGKPVPGRSAAEMWSELRVATKEIFTAHNIPLNHVTIVGLPGDNEKYGDVKKEKSDGEVQQ